MGPSDLSDNYVKHILEDADENGDGGLELDEFTAIMNKILISSERNKWSKENPDKYVMDKIISHNLICRASILHKNTINF